jgi:hypothetical protein
MDHGPVHQRLLVVARGIDEGFQQMDRGDADDRRGELLEHARVDV